jgi:hypothetical protein
MEKIYDINSNLMIYNNRVDTSEFILDLSLKDFKKISMISISYFLLISILYIKNNVFNLLDYVMYILGYVLTFSIALIYRNALEKKKININNFKKFHKYFITFFINIASLTNLAFLVVSNKNDSLYITRYLNLELFYIFFLTVLLKLEEYGYGGLWIFNLYFVHIIESKLSNSDVNLNLEKLFCLALCACSIIINQDSNKRVLKNYIIHKKTQRYIDHLINKMFCLFFAWNNNKVVFVNKIAKNFINNKYDSNEQDTSPDDDNYDQLSKGKNYK